MDLDCIYSNLKEVASPVRAGINIGFVLLSGIWFFLPKERFV
jgi:hypothetical protein